MWRIREKTFTPRQSRWIASCGLGMQSVDGTSGTPVWTWVLSKERGLDAQLEEQLAKSTLEVLASH